MGGDDESEYRGGDSEEEHSGAMEGEASSCDDDLQDKSGQPYIHSKEPYIPIKEPSRPPTSTQM